MINRREHVIVCGQILIIIIIQVKVRAMELSISITSVCTEFCGSDARAFLTDVQFLN